jgi:Pyruvate/2-oxoacid:ferredoxin oxidoreductase delta subunit
MNAMLESRGLAKMEIACVSPKEWAGVFGVLQDRKSRMSRRRFLRQAVRSAAGKGAHSLVRATFPHAEFTPPGAILADNGQGSVMPFLPGIDPHLCSGCDACIRVCPHGAIAFEESEPHGYGYRMDARYCTGCRLCVDVCDQNAVNVASWQRQCDQRVSLQGGRCSACGASYHLPSVQPNHGLCHVCRHVNHAENLFQVLS